MGAYGVDAVETGLPGGGACMPSPIQGHLESQDAQIPLASPHVCTRKPEGQVTHSGPHSAFVAELGLNSGPWTLHTLSS